VVPAALLEPGLCLRSFGARRKLLVLRQAVSDLKPRGFAPHVEVAFGADPWVIIETPQSNSEFRSAFRPVHNR